MRKKLTMTDEHINYDAIPVKFCKRCHSLMIMAGYGYPDYCGKCGSTDLGEGLIDEWVEDEMYRSINNGRRKEKRERRRRSGEEDD